MGPKVWITCWQPHALILTVVLSLTGVNEGFSPLVKQAAALALFMRERRPNSCNRLCDSVRGGESGLQLRTSRDLNTDKAMVRQAGNKAGEVKCATSWQQPARRRFVFDLICGTI